MEMPTERADPRLEYLGEYVCKTLRLKPDKWNRMIVSDEQRNYLTAFIDREYPQVICFCYSYFASKAPSIQFFQYFIGRS